MQYRQIKDCRKISALGYGCLRFSKQDKKIDIGKAEQEIMLAIQNGVNYFDTAYIYPGSEEALGEILERNHCRNQVYIATKLPYYLLKSLSAVEKISGAAVPASHRLHRLLPDAYAVRHQCLESAKGYGH